MYVSVLAYYECVCTNEKCVVHLFILLRFVCGHIGLETLIRFNNTKHLADFKKPVFIG